MSSSPANIGVALSGAARDAVLAALVRAGCEVHIANNPERVKVLVARNVADAWIFDARAEDVLDVLLQANCFLLPADNIPDPRNHLASAHWVEGLMTQLEIALAGAAAWGRAPRTGRWSDVRGVWLLAGSAGATSAIQAFLNAFRQPPPVAFLYAQHLHPDQHHQLLRFTPQNPQFSLCVSHGVQTLQPGQLVMISPRCKVTLNSFGHITTTREVWAGEHTPDINELLVIMSAAKLPSPGVIVFSGMGDDGAAALRVFEATGGRVWTQSPASATCPGMPQAALATGLVQRVAEPEALSRALAALYAP